MTVKMVHQIQEQLMVVKVALIPQQLQLPRLRMTAVLLILQNVWHVNRRSLNKSSANFIQEQLVVMVAQLSKKVNVVHLTMLHVLHARIRVL